eukprot:SAG11_NODE_4542_length_1859_cov_0.990909_1_plen_288_part_00
MELIAFKWVSIVVLLLFGLGGGFLPLKISTLSQVGVHIAYAFAGGVLAAVAVVHMLDDASGDLEEAGANFAKALGGESFPLANALFTIGFFFICSVEAVLQHKLGAHAHGSGHEPDSSQSETGLQSERGLLPGKGESGSSAAAGWATLVGLSIHSVVEGVAAGAVDDAASAGAVVLAIACHKGFAAFANASVNLPMMQQPDKRILWFILVIWFAVSGTLRMIIGIVVTDDLDGVSTAVVTALAAGTLLSVGFSEMLLPSFQNGEALEWKIFSASTSMLAMSLLAVWA